MPKLLILALLIAVLVYPVGGSLFASKEVHGNRRGGDHKRKHETAL